VPGVNEVIAADDALPPFDVHVPMLSLPLVFKTTLESIPWNGPYLSADPVRREGWRERLGGNRARLKVGLAWAGNPRNVPLRKRDVPWNDLSPLLSLDGVDFYSLQVDRGEAAASLIDHTSHLHDLADTAAFMAELDLIISVDTAVAHLAGALGRPVWTLLSFVADWRWDLAGERAPWYPTMRLFRQPALVEWKPVIQRVTEELRAAAVSHLPRPK